MNQQTNPDLVSGEIKHTKTPWRVGELNMNAIEIKHDDDSKGAMSLVLARVVARPTWIAEAEANAKFIVRAVNAHDDLVTSLNDLYTLIHDMGWTTADDRYVSITNAAAALAKAGAK